MPATMMALQDILFSQGFGTRRICCGLVQQGLVQVGADGATCTDPTEAFEETGLVFRVQGETWHYHALAYLMLHKPAGYECSQKPSTYPSIYTLLPGPLRNRGGGAAAGVQAVGRLDQDTTGLLLLSDDGKFIHRMTSPRHHVPKVYEVTLKHAGDQAMVRRLDKPAKRKTRGKNQADTPIDPATGFHAHRLAQSQRSRVLNSLLIELKHEYGKMARLITYGG